MGSVNKVILVGNLGADPELKYTTTNKAVCNFSVATNEVRKGPDGSKIESVEWHRVTTWDTTAESCSQYLKRGRTVYVEGRLRTREYKDKDGYQRKATEVIADRVVFLGDAGGKKEAAPVEAPSPLPVDQDLQF